MFFYSIYYHSKHVQGGESTDEILKRLLKEHEAELTYKLMKDQDIASYVGFNGGNDFAGKELLRTSGKTEKV